MPKVHPWGNVENNQAGELLDTCLYENNLICLNDYQPTYRHSNSVIDLFVIKPHLSAKVKLCQTLTHECVRRDHISVLLDFDDGQQEEVIKREQYNIRKTSMNEWKLITDERFKKWNESWEKMPDQDIDEVWDSFLQVFRECMDEVVPKMTIQVGKRRTKPCGIMRSVKKVKMR